MYTFTSKVEIRGVFPSNYPDEIIKIEPMFFNSSLEYAYDNGSMITKKFIENLPEDWHYSTNPVLDSRVHMLMPGWYPCIPGYHHDDVPRSTASGQPNYDNPEYHSEHLMGLINGDICPTMFAIGKHELPKVDGIIYKQWHKIVEQQISKKALTPYEAPSGAYIQFDANAMHTGQRAVKGGWRWFVRLSRNTSRQKKMTNEIRSQVQVYLEFPMEGW